MAIIDITGPLEKPDIKVLGNTLLSQVALHEQYGGVFPMLAKREHEKSLPILLEQTLRESGYKLTDDQLPTTNDIDFIAVTAGPGLEPALWAGIVFAEELGKKWGKPVVPVNHMEGHIWSVLYQDKFSKLELPALALLVSGGHTELVFVKDFGQYEILGRTVDDAVGEAFDKVARMLGLPYPGGPKIGALAAKSREQKKEVDFTFPRPMINSGNLNFSYSGLKTAVLYKLKKDSREDDEYKQDIARAFQDAALEVLVSKSRQALETLGPDIKSFIVGGGVANDPLLRQELEKMLREFPDVRFYAPQRELSTDNALMIGIAAFVEVSCHPELLTQKIDIKARGNLTLK